MACKAIQDVHLRYKPFIAEARRRKAALSIWDDDALHNRVDNLIYDLKSRRDLEMVRTYVGSSTSH